ncbi:MAG: tetratricopeptide repeat protein [Myxococcota bacterium]|nr:tetratricopeptide repeat protein [Myxococcota bacterium]
MDAAVREALWRVLEGDLDGAEELLSAAVQRDSTQPDVYLALARLFRRRGETGRAIRVHQNLMLRKDVSEAHREEALLGLAGDFQQGGFLQRAIAAYEEVIARRPREPQALRALARLYADVRHYPKALEMTRRLARAEGRDGRREEARLWVECAAAAQAEGRTPEASRALKKALRRDPRLAAAWDALGGLEVERGRTRKALAAWKRVPELDRAYAARVYPRLEATYAALGKSRDYEALLRKLMESEPRDPAARLALAQALSARGESEQAVAEVRAVLDQDPEHLAAHATLGRVLLAKGHHAESSQAFAALLDTLERRGLLVGRVDRA